MVDQKKDVRWIEVKFECSGELAEALAEVLGRFVSNGVVVESVTVFNPHTQENEPTGEMAVSGYLTADESLQENQRKLEEALWHLGQIMPVPEPRFTPVYDQDWMEAWKVHYAPIPIGKNMLIMPAWKEPRSGEKRTIIRINPAMAFGTGTHPTTQLCLQLTEKYLSAGDAIIDVGCGSGILSIAALKLGAVHALAVDISNEAVTSTLENAGLNDLSSAVLETGKGSVEEILTGRFSMVDAPLVLINILAPIIIRLFGLGLGSLVQQDGKLLLSGLLNYQEADILDAAEKAGFSPIDRITDEDWVALALTRH